MKDKLLTKGRIFHDIFITIAVLGSITAIGFIYSKMAGHAVGYNGIENITPLYILAILLIAHYTEGYLYGIIASVIGVVCVNFMFTYPYLKLNFTITGYPVIFLVMLTIAVLTSTTTSHMKRQMQTIADHEKQLMEAEKEKMRANLLRAISHDLRTPLTGIIGTSNSYLDNEQVLDDAKKREMIMNIKEDSDWLLNMVENLLSVTRIHDGVANVKKTYESVEEVISESVSRLRKRLPEADIAVKIPQDAILIQMDCILIEQVIINILENAVIHSNSKKTIICSVEEGENMVGFHIRDFGDGIPKERLNTIFDGDNYIYKQTADSKRGMGIGLYICKTIITAHNGTIEAENHSDGAEFSFYLPK